MTRKGPNSVLIIEARFYEDIADELARGAIEELRGNQVEYERIAVPGALEIPLALSLALANGFVGRAGRHRGCIALGCVIRGKTSHYEIVARESAGGLNQLADPAWRADRPRHHHLREPRAGLGAGQRRWPQQGRRRGARLSYPDAPRAAFLFREPALAVMANRGETQNRAASRSAARLAAVQALYQMDMTGIDLNEVVAEFEAHRLGQEVEGDQYCQAEAHSSATLSKAWCASSASSIP